MKQFSCESCKTNIKKKKEKNIYYPLKIWTSEKNDI